MYHERLLWPFLDRVAEARPGAKALDLGCGTGVVTVALARRGFQVTGIDHSAEMLAIAERKLADVGLEAVLETGDVRALRFGDGEFDCVTVQGLLHHLEEPARCLSELSRVLRPGGFFYVSEPCRDETAVKRVLHSIWRLLRRPAPAGTDVESVEEPVSAHELRSTLDELGLEYDVEFLTHVPPLRRRLPDAAYLFVVRVLSLPWRRRRGDLVFVFGRKP